MRFRHGPSTLDKIELQMTPMIDIVFQLNIFFLFTFQIVLPEGDFNVHMPSAAAARAIQTSEAIPMMVVLKAGPNGELADLLLNGQSFGSGQVAFARLHHTIRGHLHGHRRSHRLHRKRRAAQVDRAHQVHAAGE
jgi:hypothetical protein